MDQENRPYTNGHISHRKRGSREGAVGEQAPAQPICDQGSEQLQKTSAAASAIDQALIPATTIDFEFQGNSMRTVTTDGQTWFVAADVCAALEHTDASKAVSRLDDDEKGATYVRTLGGAQRMNVVNESGLYSLIFTSRVPRAKAFRRWVTGEVLPAIRTAGRYEMGRGGDGQPGRETGIHVALPGRGRYVVMVHSDGTLHVRRTEFDAMIAEAAAIDCEIMACALKTTAGYWHKVQQLRSLGMERDGGFAATKLEQAIVEGADLAWHYLNVCAGTRPPQEEHSDAERRDRRLN